jgi:hypothetical protein
MRHLSSLPDQSKAPLMALLCMALFVFVFAQSSVSGSDTAQTEVHFGIEHMLPLTLTIATDEGMHGSVIEMGHNSQETIYLSVPDSWKRHEVKNIPLKDVAKEPPSFGYIRWTFPPGALVSFTTKTYPDSLVLHNPSEIPLKVDIIRTNLQTETVTKDIKIIQNSPAEIW